MITTAAPFNTRKAAAEALAKMGVRQNSITINERFVVVRRKRNDYHLGELGGDWLMGGTAAEVLARAFDGQHSTWTECEVAIHENLTGEDADDSRKYW
jgi:hypothetical protein